MGDGAHVIVSTNVIILTSVGPWILVLSFGGLGALDTRRMTSKLFRPKCPHLHAKPLTASTPKSKMPS